MEEKLMVTSSPHLQDKASTSSIMLDVCIALLPALICAEIIFGVRVLLVTGVSVAACFIFEYLLNMITKRPQTISDLSCAVTGILLAFCLPVSLPLWMVVIGDFVAIVIVKGLFGGIGQNFANPAATARIVLMLSFPVQMTTWTAPVGADATASATVLDMVKHGTAGEMPSLWQMFIGYQGGSLGETCAAALIVGGIYLLFRKVIQPHVPLAFIGTVAIFSLLTGRDPLVQILSGGVMLGAIFMATDYTTSAITPVGKVVFGIGCGLLTCLIRFFSSSVEGVSYAILLMNILCPFVDRLTRSRPFGGAKA